MTLVLFSLHLKVLAHLIVSQEVYFKTSANVKGTLETFTATHFGTTYMISQLPPLLQPPMPICQNTVLNWDFKAVGIPAPKQGIANETLSSILISLVEFRAWEDIL